MANRKISIEVWPLYPTPCGSPELLRAFLLEEGELGGVVDLRQLGGIKAGALKKFFGVLPEFPYRAEYELAEEEGEYFVAQDVLYRFTADGQIDCLVVCFLPKEWTGKKVKRTVKPLYMGW